MLLSGYTSKTNYVFNYFKKMKASSIKYCEYQSIGPGFSLNKKLDKKDLAALLRLLNHIKSANLGSAPTPKGGFTGLNLYMKSGMSFSFMRVNDGLWIDYNTHRYKIVIPGYDKYFNGISKKYDPE